MKRRAYLFKLRENNGFVIEFGEMCTGQQGSVERQNNSSKETYCVCECKLPPLCSGRRLRLCLGKRMGGVVMTVTWIVASLNMGFLGC